MARARPMPFLEEQLGRQRALGRSATQVDIVPEVEVEQGLSLYAGPRTVLVGPTGSGCARVPWQLVPAAELDQTLRTLHAQVLEDAHALPELLTTLASADPEAAAPRTVQRRLGRMLALRSVLELAAAWEDAQVPGQPAPGWTSGPGRLVGVLPWHSGHAKVGEGWHLHHLRRWHVHHRSAGRWEDLTAAWITRGALMQDAETNALLCGPLSATLEGRQRQRAAGPSSLPHQTDPLAAAVCDLDPAAFVRRVRLALSLVLEPALAGFPQGDVLAAVQGAKSSSVVLSRLLPGVPAGPVQALTRRLQDHLRQRGRLGPDEGARSAFAAGACPGRRGAWTAARAASVSPFHCLGVEAAAGPLHLLVPGLQHAGPGSPALQEDRLSSALEEVADLFTAVAALPAEQALPLPDLGGLLTGRGFLRLGAHAGPAPLTGPPPEAPVLDEDWRRDRTLALYTVPGLTEAVAALEAVRVAREQGFLQARREVCLASGLSEAELEEATGGERPFERTPGDAGLERTLHWTGGVWSLELARHPQDLVSDGRALSHCVGWGGYAHSVRAGRVRIVRVLARGPEDEVPVPLLTLELGPSAGAKGDTETALPSWKLVQARRANNRRPARDEAALLGLWAREVGVRLEQGGEVAPLSAAAVRTDAERLKVAW